MRNLRFLSGFWLLALPFVSACALQDAARSPTDTAGATPVAAAPGEVEDPETFARRDAGLWDGRPSLGGLWVAHPDARAPERVVIRNLESGQETAGALFRREQFNPGPAFQISADAAAALGILAGAPTQLEVIALRPADTAEPDETSDTSPPSTPAEDGDATNAASESAPGLLRRIFRSSVHTMSGHAPA